MPAWRQLAGFDVKQAAVASGGHRFGDQRVPVRVAAFSKGSRGALDGTGAGLDNFLFADLEATASKGGTEGRRDGGHVDKGQGAGVYPKALSWFG